MALRVAVIGLGSRGRQWVRTVCSAPRYELVACVDRDRETLRDAAASLRIPARECYVDLSEALDATRPEAVIVATSVDRHVEPCAAALARGVGVLVEKPFALSLREAQRLVAMARDAKVPIVVGQNYRYTRMPQTVRQILERRSLGRVGLVLCQAYRNGSDFPASLGAIPDSVLWETGVHHIDALRYVLGQEVVGVMAQSFTVPWSRFAPGASVQALLVFEGGVRASVCVTYDSRGHELFNQGQELYLRIMGERGTLHVFQHWILLWERGRWPRLVRRGPRPNPEVDSLLRQLEQALRTGDEPECSGRDNLKTLAVLEACARSAAEGRWVNPQEFLDVQR